MNITPDNLKPFWMVWNPNGHAPTFRHPSKESAEREAERLARANPDRTFVVLESVCARRVDSMICIDLRPTAEDEIPF